MEIQIPIHYGSGYMRVPLNGLATLFMGKGELIGHSGSTGSFAFYYPCHVYEIMKSKVFSNKGRNC